MDGEKNLGGKDRDFRRHADQRRHFESFDAANEIDQQHAKHGRPHERQGHLPESLNRARSRGKRGFFQRRIHVAESRRHQEKHQRIKVDRLRPDHPPHRVDIERRRFEAEKLFDNDIDQTDFRTQQKNPRNRAQDPGDDERDQRHDDEQLLQGRVRSFTHPGEKRPNQEGKAASAESVVDRIEKKEVELFIEVRLDVVLNRVSRTRLANGSASDAAVEQHQKRNPRKI